MNLPNINLSDAANITQIVSLPVSLAIWWWTKDDAKKFFKVIRWPLLIYGVGAMLYWLFRHGWFDWVGTFLSWRVPMWGVFSVILSLVLLAIGVVWIISVIEDAKQQNNKEQSAPKPRHWKDYTSDNIFGVEWNWGYYGNQIQEHSFSMFCPHTTCRHRLELKEDYERMSRGYHYGPPLVTAFCPRCSFSRNFDWDKDTLIRRAATEVERRINTGEFRNSRENA